MSPFQVVAPLVAIMLSVAVTNPAHADITPALSSFTFTGQCADCAGTATGTLILQNYNLGDSLNKTNFVSFSYNGTNLFAPHTITEGSTTYVSGSIDAPLPASENFTVQDLEFSFASGTPGYWCVGGSCNADFGQTHQWSAATSTTVPEPLSLSLLAGGLLGLAALRRKI